MHMNEFEIRHTNVRQLQNTDLMKYIHKYNNTHTVLFIRNFLIKKIKFYVFVNNVTFKPIH